MAWIATTNGHPACTFLRRLICCHGCSVHVPVVPYVGDFLVLLVLGAPDRVQRVQRGSKATAHVLHHPDICQPAVPPALFLRVPIQFLRDVRHSIYRGFYCVCGGSAVDTGAGYSARVAGFLGTSFLCSCSVRAAQVQLPTTHPPAFATTRCGNRAGRMRHLLQWSGRWSPRLHGDSV